MIHRLRLVALAVGAIVLIAPTQAAADAGAGVGASPVVLAATAQPGNSYRLPALYVVNTGTVASSYEIRVERLTPGPGQSVPAEWVHFERNDFPLGPKESVSISMTLAVPTTAHAGQYQSDLIAGTVASRHPDGGAVLGAQAATELRFRVGSDGGFPWPWPAWGYAVTGAVLAVGAGMAAQRRFGFRVHLERRR